MNSWPENHGNNKTPYATPTRSADFPPGFGVWLDCFEADRHIASKTFSVGCGIWWCLIFSIKQQNQNVRLLCIPVCDLKNIAPYLHWFSLPFHIKLNKDIGTETETEDDCCALFTTSTSKVSVSISSLKRIWPEYYLTNSAGMKNAIMLQMQSSDNLVLLVFNLSKRHIILTFCTVHYFCSVSDFKRMLICHLSRLNNPPNKQYYLRQRWIQTGLFVNNSEFSFVVITTCERTVIGTHFAHYLWSTNSSTHKKKTTGKWGPMSECVKCVATSINIASKFLCCDHH